MPGDVVRRHIPGEDTQCGFVMDMDVRAHLHILRTNKYIYNVDSKDLEPIQVNVFLHSSLFYLLFFGNFVHTFNIDSKDVEPRS